MDFQKLVEVYEELEKISSGNLMREILSEFFKKVPKEDLGIVAYLTLGQIASEYESVVLGMAEKSVLKAVAAASGRDLLKVKDIMRKKGDVGLTAEENLKHKQQTLVPLRKLTVQELFDKLHKIAKTNGPGSQDSKTSILVSLLQRTSPLGAKYICRIALGTLRMGVGDMTVLDALAIAFTKDKKNKEILEKAYNLCPDIGLIAETLAKNGLKGLGKIDIQIGRPIKMMLAQRVDEWDNIKKKIPGELAVEGKYDGERVQAHKKNDGSVLLFSRRLDNITEQFPDLVEYLNQNINAKEFIAEAEIIAINEEGKHQPFQVLMQRRRKHDVQQYIKKIPIQAKMFDLLYLNGRSLINSSYQERYELLSKIVNKSKHVTLSDRTVNPKPDQLKDFFKKMLKEGYEGIMIKSLSGEYQAGTRGWNWIKWKKEYAKDLSDTFDLAIVGAFYGKGRRSGVYGALLCAVYNEREDSFETLCKLGTGLTDAVLAELPVKLEKFKVEKKPARVNVKKEMEPDVWFTPAMVVEVLAAEITKSPFHTAELALRFPRFVKFREDKKAEQATTLTEIREI